MNFGNFHIEKWIPQTFRAQKIDEKKWDHLSSFFFWNFLNCEKIVSFLQFFADVSKISKAVIAVYVYTSENSRFALLENDIGYYAMT